MESQKVDDQINTTTKYVSYFQILDSIREEQIKINQKLENIEKLLKDNHLHVKTEKKVKFENLHDLCLGC